MPLSRLPEPSLALEPVLDCFEAIALGMYQTQSFDDILNTAVREVHKVLQTDRVLICRCQPDGRGVAIAESVSSGWIPVLNPIIDDKSFTNHKVEGLGDFSAIADIYTSDIQPSDLDVLAQFQVRAHLVVPIVENTPTQTLLWGWLMAHHCSETRHWQPLEVKLLQQIAIQIAIAIRQTRVVEQLQTERVQCQEEQAKLQGCERLLHSIYDGAANSIFIVDVLPSGEFRWAGLNPAHERLTGLCVEDIQGKSPEQVFPSAVAAAVSANYARCVQAGTTISYEECLPFAEEESWWLTTLTPLRDEQSRIYQLTGTSINITYAKQIEQELRRQQEFLHNVIDTSPNLICVKDWEGRFTLVNQALADIYETTIENLVGKTDADFNSHAEEVEHYLQDDREVMTLLQPKFIPEEILTSPSGAVHYLQTIKKPLVSPTGRMRYVLATAIEITERKRIEQERDREAAEKLRLFEHIKRQNQTLEAKVQERTAQLSMTNEQLKQEIAERTQAQEELRKSEERWQLVLKGNNDGIWDLNLKTNQVFRSTRYKEMLGYQEHELGDNNDDWQTRIHPDDFERVMQINQDYLARKIPHYAVEYRQRCKDGTYKWVFGRAQAIWDAEGAPVRMVGSTTDISDRKQAEEALRQSEQQFRQIFQEAPIGISVANSQTHRFLTANPAWCQILGYSLSELQSLTFDEISHPDDLLEDLHNVEQIEQGKIDSFRMEKRYRKKNGEFIWTNLTVTVIPSQEGKLQFNLAMIEDITERRQLQIDLLNSEERFRTSVENMLDCFGIYTAIRAESGEIVDFLIEYINAAACVTNCLTKEEQIGKRLCEILPAHRPIKLFDEYCQLVETGQPLVKEAFFYEDNRQDGNFSGTFELRAVKLGDGFACAWRDVTERQQTEAQVKSSLQEKETLLKEIHHRVKNNLQIISSLLRLQSRQIRDRQTLALFKESQNRVQAMSLIHEKLYQSSNLSQINFQEYITSLVGNLCRSYDTYRRGVTFTINVEPVALAIDTAIPCGLIINELITNSLKYAFPENQGGEIGISLQYQESHLNTPLDKEHFILTIRDNGIGLPQDLDVRNTESLGLQLMCRLTKQIGGSLELNRSQGTEFKIAFATPISNSRTRGRG